MRGAPIELSKEQELKEVFYKMRRNLISCVRCSIELSKYL